MHAHLIGIMLITQKLKKCFNVGFLIGTRNMYTYSVLGGRTRAPPDAPIYVRGAPAPPTPPHIFSWPPASLFNDSY